MSIKAAVVGFLGSLLIRTLRATWRIDEQPAREVTRRQRDEGPAVYVMWHSRILLGAATQSGQGLQVMISQHGDGELIARAVHRLGFGTVRGSTTRGGREALREVTRLIAAGHPIAMTPDGPKGPRLVVQPGCVLAALRAGVPVIPVGFDARTKKRFASWDRFILPAPFTRVAVRFGRAVHIPADRDGKDVAHWVAEVQRGLLAVTREAAQAVGAPVETPESDPLESR